MLHVWVDQDLCTGDGLCTDHCPEPFVLLEDGISYVIGSDGEPGNDPGGSDLAVPVPDEELDLLITAALDCPGECIFIDDIAHTSM